MTLVSLLTDFGPGSVYVGQIHAVILSRYPSARIVDVAHDCPAGGIEAAAYILRRSYVHFPEGSVHTVVVDPGVGTDRSILAARAHGHLFVGPDNGVFGNLLLDAEVYSIENTDLMADEISHTFHGRDIMAPVAAYLAAGGALEAVGPAAQASRFEGGPTEAGGGINGRVLIEDRYGNAITNIPGRLVADVIGSGVRVRIGATFIDGVVRTFADVPPGCALAYYGSGGHLEVAVNAGRASDALHLHVGDPIRVEASPR